MGKMLVKDLEGTDLDKLVAKADNVVLDDQGVMRQHHGITVYYIHEHTDAIPYSPSTNWNLGGPIIHREGIDLEAMGWVDTEDRRDWMAIHPFGSEGILGPTPLIAAMRAYCVLKFGEEVG